MTVPQRVLDTMNSGLIYTCDDEEMIKAQQEQMELLYEFNATHAVIPHAFRDSLHNH